MGVARRWISLAAGVTLVAALFGCASSTAGTGSGGSSGDSSDGSTGQSAGSTNAAGIHELPTGVKFDYQLGGDYTAPAGVKILTRDSTATPVAGLYNICYINGFQTQDEDKSFWLAKHPDLVLRYTSGSHPKDGGAVFDPGWPNEMILDASTAAKRTAIAAVQGATIDRCKAKGFQAVEFDNLDSYSRSHHELTLADDLALATLFVAKAHADGLAAGQKNTAELGSRGHTVAKYDFAVSEECYRYDECASYTKVYGAQVLDIEYTDDLRGTFASNCAAKQIPPMTILRDRDLTGPRSKHYVYQAC